MMNEVDLKKWVNIVTDAPTVEEIKIEINYFPLGKILNEEELLTLLGNKMMPYDKHGPLDLILYDDSHEEPRKWARNRIREMKLDQLMLRLKKWSSHIKQPEINDLLTPAQLKKISDILVKYIDNLNPLKKMEGSIKNEKISLEKAYASLRQLIEDLSEAVLRCSSRQNFLSTSLFLFWSCDELIQLQPEQDKNLIKLGENLLSNYIATAILIEKKIHQEQQIFTILMQNTSLFYKLERTRIIENRHNNLDARKEYDCKFGLTII
jgi:hypothetical protein